MDSEYYTNINLIKYLLDNTIDNNISGYTLINEIKLISISNEIIFYRVGNNTDLTNGENIGINHILKQIKDIIKYNKNYTLDYQFMALGKEKNRDVYTHSHDKEIEYNGNDFENRNIQSISSGRVDRLIFSLCHDYFETC